MKAVVFDRHGGLDALRYDTVADPEPGPTMVVIKVEAVALNGFDPMILRGIPGLKTPLPMTPGADVAGTIVTMGGAVTGWHIGDRVTVLPMRHGVGMMGETIRGAASEYFAVEAAWLLRMPAEISFEDAAALPTAYGTAHRMLVHRGRVAAGERVLILGAAGGVGTACVQLARLAGAYVIGCTRSTAKAERLRALGAHDVIILNDEALVPAIHRRFGKPKIAGGGGVDVAVNFTGGESWTQTLKVVRADGRILTCGATAGYDPPEDIRYIWSFELNIIGCNAWHDEDQITLLDLVAAGKIRPIIDTVLPLADIREAMHRMIQQDVFGKLLLKP